ncbi:hypothetical protein MSG28_014568 [Choristoneura fumiferana]|uniref:Uncharacterized protein n=1 Tax=Choristoneura fumiferana TaxID=7141 RepID=A0ACC0JRZ8_CHOFU|nr:hypothetical protein MSG28_014568 [Choristoneura fumiferana]
MNITAPEWWRSFTFRRRSSYPCSQCDQKFLTSAELESHRQIHEHADNMSINLDFVTSLHLDALADDYSLIDPSYLDLNEL